MKPNFSLSLSFDGIRLLHRDKSGWTEIGSVSLEEDDLAGALSSLRTTALEQAPGGMRTKLIIPNEQIKYITLPGTGLGDAGVRAALEGATPYEVDELRYDFAEHEGGTVIAAVANETLEEAEAFAVEHEFAPVCFVAVPAEGTFPGEPFFGKAKAANGTRVTRDKTPVPLAPTPPARTGADPAARTADDPVEADLPAQVDTSIAATADATNPNDFKAEAGDVDAEPETFAPDTDIDAGPAAEDIAPETAGTPADDSAPGAEVAEAPLAEADLPATADPDLTRDSEDGLAIGAAASPEFGDAFDAPEPADETATGPRDIAMAEPPPAAEEPTAGSDDALPDDALHDDSAHDDAVREQVAEDEAAGQDDQDGSTTAAEPAERPPAEPVFSSRLRGIRQQLDMPPPVPPLVRLPNGSMSPPTLDRPGPSATRGAAPLAAGGTQSGPRTPMPPAVAEALKKVERRETVPPRVSTSEATQDVPPPTAFRPATPPPPAVSKALERVRNSPNLPPVNGSAQMRPIPGAGPQAPVASAPPSLPSAPSRSELPPPVRQTATSAGADGPIPAPPAEVGASLSASAGPAGPAPLGAKGGKRGFGLFGRGDKGKPSPLPPTAEPLTPKTEATRSESEKERLTVFGARRRDQEVRGKPRFLGLILTAVLLLLMAAVAAWATISTDAFARIFSRDDAPVVSSVDVGSETPAALVAPEVAAEPATEAAAPEPAFEPTPLPASELPEAPGTIPTAQMLMSETGSLLPDADLLRALSASTPALAVSEVPGDVLSPAAAERFYAATGVWLRSPRLPVEPQPEPLGSVARSVSEPRPDPGPRPELAQTAPDAMLVAQLDPPPPDMRFERDERGFLLATPDGTVTPYGLVIYAGSPSIVPPTRPGTPPVPAPASKEPLAPDEAAPAAAERAAEPATGPAAPDTTEAIVAEATETLASEALAVLVDAPVRPDARISTAGALNAAAISLDGIRPLPRPDDAVPEDLLPGVELASFAGPRPPLRPEGLAPEADTAEAPEDENPLPGDLENELAGILAGATDPLATATANAVSSAIRPDSRPRNFDRVVQQARARQPRPSAPAASAPAAASAPEAVSNAAAQPTGPVPQTVASAATQENAINLRQINLIGVYGRPSDRRALVRLSNGRYVRVGVGDRLDGGQVAAINDDTLNYVKSGRTLTLEIPSG